MIAALVRNILCPSYMLTLWEFLRFLLLFNFCFKTGSVALASAKLETLCSLGCPWTSTSLLLAWKACVPKPGPIISAVDFKCCFYDLQHLTIPSDGVVTAPWAEGRIYWGSNCPGHLWKRVGWEAKTEANWRESKSILYVSKVRICYDTDSVNWPRTCQR